MGEAALESLIYSFMEYFFPISEIPEPILAGMGFVLAFVALYMLMSFFQALFGRFFGGR